MAAFFGFVKFMYGFATVFIGLLILTFLIKRMYLDLYWVFVFFVILGFDLWVNVALYREDSDTKFLTNIGLVSFFLCLLVLNLVLRFFN